MQDESFSSDIIVSRQKFGDGSGRELHHLSAAARARSETWLPFDVERDRDAQYAEQAWRCRRFYAYYVRLLVNGALKDDRKVIDAARHGLLEWDEANARTGFERIYFVYSDVVQAALRLNPNLPQELSRLLEGATDAGFVTPEEARGLRTITIAQLDDRLAPRPPGLPQGPPVIVQRLNDCEVQYLTAWCGLRP